MKNAYSKSTNKPFFDSWAEALKSQSLFVAFDRDGTLVPICDHPADATPSEEVTLALSELARAPEIITAIVSARSINNLSSDFENGNTILAGNYGLEIRFPGKADYIHPAAAKSRHDIAELKLKLSQLFPAGSQLLLDDNVYSITLHWHLMTDSESRKLHNVVGDLKQEYKQLLWRQGTTSYEVLPLVEWSKAHALQFIQQSFEPDNRPELSIYFGDSDHDECAFNWVNASSGISVRVGIEQETSANSHMQSPDDVHDFVQNLLAIRTAFSQTITN